MNFKDQSPPKKCDICDLIHQRSVSKEVAEEYCKNCISKHLMDLFKNEDNGNE